MAPDYLLVDQSVADDLLVEIRRAIRTQFSEDPLSNPDYPKIVDRTAYDRLVKLLSNGRLVAGGECDPGRLTIAPTVIDGIGPEDPLMEDEIFGPILPVFRFRGEEGLFEFLRGPGEAAGALLFRSLPQAAQPGWSARPVPARWYSTTWSCIS